MSNRINFTSFAGVMLNGAIAGCFKAISENVSFQERVVLSLTGAWSALTMDLAGFNKKFGCLFAYSAAIVAIEARNFGNHYGFGEWTTELPVAALSYLLYLNDNSVLATAMLSSTYAAHFLANCILG